MKPFTPQNILIVKLGSLGDIVHALPVSATLRVSFPKARIAWLVEEKSKDILYKNPDVDELIVIRLKHWGKKLNMNSFREAKEAWREIRQQKFDTVLDLQGLIKSGVLSLLSGASRRIGFHLMDCREWPNAFFSNDRGTIFGNEDHVVRKNLSLLRLLGIPKVNYSFPITIPSRSEEYIANYFTKQRELGKNPLVAINPGAGFSSKRWQPERFALVADRVSHELKCDILLTWGPGEESQIEAISKKMTRPHWVAPPTTIQQSLALYKKINLFVGCDTGPLHLCAALGTPTVSIFGPTNPARNGPFGAKHITVFKVLACSFCHKRVCPTQNECMEEVKPNEVFEAIQKSLYNLVKDSIRTINEK